MLFLSPLSFSFLFSHIRLCDVVGRAGTFLRPPKGGQRSGLAASPCLLVRGGSGDGGEEEKDRLPHTLILYCALIDLEEGYQVADLSGLDTMLGNVESPGSFFYCSVSGTLSSDSFFCYPSGD